MSNFRFKPRGSKWDLPSLTRAHKIVLVYLGNTSPKSLSLLSIMDRLRNEFYYCGSNLEPWSFSPA